ncbi:HpcH/HpaI aldolase/citrate lyase family protein [Nocardia sp. NPDC052566]|uniref:HpcH/HpaI aldolase/citrate lyase family protein n=1 Tax=Nocardia sp. NPDC052566 TaxID=3364330 RepID=UPI0037CCA49C
MSAGVRAIPRSLLCTPALSLDTVVKSWSYDADVHIIDLEDSIPGPVKAGARQICREALDKAPDAANVGVRINELGTIEAVHDLLMLTEGAVKPGFVVVPMVRFPAELVVIRKTFASAGAYPELYATIETAAAVARMDAIAAQADGLMLGSADLAADIGVEITWDGMLAARQRMAIACAEHGIGCIDTPCFHLAQPAVLVEEIARVRALGFHGKITVHPKELEAINQAFRPDAESLWFAHRVTRAVHAAAGGIAVLDGDMIGPPFARKARSTVALGEAWAKRFGSAVDARRGAKEPAHDHV